MRECRPGSRQAVASLLFLEGEFDDAVESKGLGKYLHLLQSESRPPRTLPVSDEGEACHRREMQLPMMPRQAGSRSIPERSPVYDLIASVPAAPAGFAPKGQDAIKPDPCSGAVRVANYIYDSGANQSPKSHASWRLRSKPCESRSPERHRDENARCAAALHSPTKLLAIVPRGFGNLRSASGDRSAST